MSVIINNGKISIIGRILKPPPYHQHHQEAVMYKKTEKLIKKNVFLNQLFLVKIIKISDANKIGT